MQSSQLLNPQLNEIKIQLDVASQNAVSIVNAVGFEQLTERPQPNKWSIAECLEHLNLSSQAEIDVLNDTYKQIPTKRVRVEKQFKMDLVGRFLKWMLEPPPISVFKLKTTEQFQPVRNGLSGEVLPTFLTLQEKLKVCVDEANGLPLDEVKVVSPFNTKVKYNLLSCFHILLAHERRHLWQAEKVKEALRQ
jgi:hypothetical protein